MFHFKKTTIICASLFVSALILLFLAKLSFIIVLFTLALFSAAFGLLAYILVDEYLVYCKMQEEHKNELLMELSITENAVEYISNPDFYNKHDLKKIKAQKRSKVSMIILTVVMASAFLLLLILKLISP